MPEWWFILGLIALVSFMAWELLPLWSAWETFENPDRAMAYFALFLGLALLAQQIYDFQYGLVWAFSLNADRATIVDKQRRSVIPDSWAVAVFAAYWLFLACALFAIVAVIRGQIREFEEKKERRRDATVKARNKGENNDRWHRSDLL